MNTNLHKAPIRSDLFDGTLNGYQDAAQTTAIYPGKGSFWGLNYVALKMNGEAGEIAEKIGKLMRDKGVQPFDQIPVEAIKDLVKECGDVLWYIAAAAKELGFSLEEVAALNIAKLKDRQERNKLSGSGDNR